MSKSTLELLGNNEVKITFTISSENFEKGIQKAYLDNRSKVDIQGFRKGKAPRQIVEKMYGAEFYHEDGLNNALPEAYGKAIEEHELNIVSRPNINVVSSTKEDGVVVEATVFVKPEVTVKDYKGVEIEKVEEKILAKDVNKKLEEEAEKNSRTEEVKRGVKVKDIVNLNFEGFVDGEAFEGGKGENFDLTIGSNTFIDTFEDQLVGLKAGEEKEVNVTFPKDYGQANLANKKAMFKVKINTVKTKTLPKIDDEFAKDFSEFETIKEYKASIKKELQVARKETAKRERENKIVEKLIEKTKFDIPEAMIENQVDNHIRDYAQQLKSQGLELEMYLEYMGQTIESLREVYKVDAEKQVRGRLILEAISKAENFEIKEEEVDKELTRISEVYKMPIENLKKAMRPEDIEGLKADLKTQKALELLVSTVKEI